MSAVGHSGVGGEPSAPDSRPTWPGEGRADGETPARPVILASASPRRRELLSHLGLAFQVLPNNGEEHDILPAPEITAMLPACPLPLAAHPTLLAWRKAHVACAEAQSGVIIGADTIVVLDGDVLGKPRDPDHARAMLGRLSGRTHTVYTGLAVLGQAAGSAGAHPRDRPPAGLQFELVASAVMVAELTDAEIDAYVATGEPLDKAGSYGIQGLGGRLVRAVVGSYTSVVGLPLVAVHRMLTGAGISGLLDPTEAYRRWLGAQGKEPLPCPPTFP